MRHGSQIRGTCENGPRRGNLERTFPASIQGLSGSPRKRSEAGECRVTRGIAWALCQTRIRRGLYVDACPTGALALLSRGRGRSACGIRRRSRSHPHAHKMRSCDYANPRADVWETWTSAKVLHGVVISLRRDLEEVAPRRPF